MAEKLKYEELKLGEKAKEALLQGRDLNWIKENCPVYINMREVYAGLNVTDLIIAAELAGIPTLLVGDTGCGKSQVVQDIYNSHFNGNLEEGGHGVKIRGAKPDLDIYEEIYTKVNREKGKRELTGKEKALIHYLDEINRSPTISQNQFFGLGDGYLEHAGMKVPIGNEYYWTVATANLGNGEFQGTFNMDKALCNRFGVVIDFDYEMFKPTISDRYFIKISREISPQIKEAPRKELSDLIIQSHREISEQSVNIGLETIAVANYLEFGLEICPGDANAPKRKEKVWPFNCQECSRNSNKNALCSLSREPPERTIQAAIKYATALQYLIKLKAPEQKIDAVDLMFKAFELTSAYQRVLNPQVLKVEYQEQNPLMMAEVISGLRKDFKENEDFILTSLSESIEGKKAVDYCESNGKISLGYNSLTNKAKKAAKKLEPFTDKREVGLGWVNDIVETNIEIAKSNKTRT